MKLFILGYSLYLASLTSFLSCILMPSSAQRLGCEDDPEWTSLDGLNCEELENQFLEIYASDGGVDLHAVKEACRKEINNETKTTALDACCFCEDGTDIESNNTMVPSFSVAPSLVPSVSSQPSASSAPSIECPCPDCYHTATCNPDPHYLTWDNSHFDFQGGCDQVAVDNAVLEIQIRTRPRNYYSTMTQAAIRFKQTNEIFHVEAGVGVHTNSLTAASGVTFSTSNPYPWSPTYTRHEITFNGLVNSYILINEEPWDIGLSMQIRGHGSVFCGSEGMFGSWNYGGVRFPNGTPYDTSGGWTVTAATSIALAQAWMVGAPTGTTSLLNNPSTVCDASSSCGNPGDAFSCASTRKRDRNLRELQGSCGTTDCTFIENDIVRGACERDLDLSGGDAKWTCQSAYTDPVFEEADPCDFIDGDCPAPVCQDSPVRMKTQSPNGRKVVTGFCSRITSFRREQRCNNVPGATEVCPLTCESCESCSDPAAGVLFLITGIGWKNCEWVALDTAVRCPLIGNSCRKTCGACY